MHAYLVIGNSEECTVYSKELAQKLKAKILEFPLAKINDTRELKKVIKITFTEPTVILIKDIDKATEEALNAFLKNLEEPQENIYYVLTAKNPAVVLPTIISRCQVIKITNSKSQILNKDAKKFLKLTIGGKLAFIDKIKEREVAKEFVQNLIKNLHFDLLSLKNNKVRVAKDLEILVKTLNNLNSNGNVGLQLANMVINSDSIGVNLV